MVLCWKLGAAFLLAIALGAIACSPSHAPDYWPLQVAGIDVRRSRIAFAANSATVNWGDDAEVFRKTVLARGRDDERLVIIGMSLPGEQSVHNGVPLGYLRAQAVKPLFDALPAERIEVESRDSTDATPDAPMIRLEWRAVIAPVFIAESMPLSFNYGSAIPITSDQIDALKQALNTGAPGQRLEITVRYFEGESEVLARARGEAVQALLQPTIATNRTVINVRAEAAWPYGPQPGELTAFRWINP